MAAPRVNVAPAVAVPLAAASQGVQAITKLASKHDLQGKLSTVGGHPVLQKLSAEQDLILAILGFLLVLHGAHFKNLFLCSQLFVTFLFVRVKSSVLDIYQGITSISEEATKGAAKALDTKGADKKAHVEAATTVLKALDSEKIGNATKEVLICLMATLLVLHGGLPQRVAIAHALVGSVGKRVEALLHFEGFQDLEKWTTLLVHFVLWSVFLPMTFLFGHVALILNVSAAGASLLSRHGALFLAKIGKVPDAKAVLESLTGLGAFAGLALFGTFWQFWSWVAGSTLPWYFTMTYLPFVIAEGVLGSV